MNIITVGKRLIPVDQIAYVEPFELSSNPNFTPERDFKARIILLNRDPVLTEQTPAAFAEEHRFNFLAEDDVALNGLVPFKVEMFTPHGNFTPTKPFKTRLKWRDPLGADQSKLLMTEPMEVAGVISKAPLKLKTVRSTRPRSRPRPMRDTMPAK
jgi:hypothetical protein